MNDKDQINTDADQERADAVYKKKSPKRITAITAVVVVAVIALNILVSVFGDARLWYFDMTRGKYKSAESAFYTLSDTCKDLIGEEAVPSVREINAERRSAGLAPIKVNIVFCAEKDRIEQDEMMRYVSYTARTLAKTYPDCIDVQYVNMTKNPSSVQKYKTTSAANIYTSDVIVEFGSEYLVQSINSFYYTETTESSPWAYNGEKRLSAMILSMTRAESPICCITNNHGELLFDENGEVKESYTTFIEVVEGAGYEVRYFDLEKEEIPENCRMIITFAPTEDLKAYGNLGENNVSEIEKLDKYLDAANAFFYICDRETPALKNLDEYLEEWGVTVSRVADAAGTNENYSVLDSKMCVDMGEGNAIIGNYATEGLGAMLTEDMRETLYPAKVVFGNSTSITPADNYFKSYVAADSETGTAAYSYYRYFKNGIGRNMLDIFTTYSSAYACVAGEQYEIATENNLFKLMTVTQEIRHVQEDNFTTVNQASYVLALSSTDFLKNEVLDSTAYGNTDVVLSALRNTSSEVIPTNVDLKAYYEYTVEDEFAYRSVEPSVWVYALWIAPALVSLVAGVVINVLRKYK